MSGLVVSGWLGGVCWLSWVGQGVFVRLSWVGMVGLIWSGWLSWVDQVRFVRVRMVFSGQSGRLDWVSLICLVRSGM